MPDLTCRKCHVPIPRKTPGTRGRQRIYCLTCGPRASDRPRRDPNEPRLCPGCQMPLALNPRERNPKVWCSDACRVWVVRNPGTPRPLSRSCKHCGTEIGHLRMDKLYCNRRCAELATADRKRVYPMPALCVWCGGLYEQKRAIHRTCSRPCGRHIYRFEHPEKYPSWNEAKKAAWQRRRALKYGADAERVVAGDIYERDGWQCGVCSRPVDAKLAWPHPASASLDHIIPLSKGGAHTAANTQLAHLRCNTEKRDSLPVAA